ncbi:hypothetical protein BH11MYX2_BH11MYX2_21820 [soil metagenome]
MAALAPSREIGDTETDAQCSAWLGVIGNASLNEDSYY